MAQCFWAWWLCFLTKTNHIMKKLILITAIIAAVSSSAFAKTQGNSVEFGILRSSSENEYILNGVSQSYYGKFEDSSFGAFLGYKHAFNFNNVFIAPGVFFDYLGLEAKDRDGDTVSSNYRYGVKLDIGYDITDSVAAYVTGGFSNVAYEVNWKSINEKKSDSESDYLIGGGISYKISKDWGMNLEYNVQDLEYYTPENSDKIGVKIAVAKLGISYNF
jgi:opacity protein-like surface antigen